MASVESDNKGAGGATDEVAERVAELEDVTERVAAEDSLGHAEGDADSEDNAVGVSACVITVSEARDVPELREVRDDSGDCVAVALAEAAAEADAAAESVLADAVAVAVAEVEAVADAEAELDGVADADAVAESV